MGDEFSLFAVRNALALHNYGECVLEASDMDDLGPAQMAEKDCMAASARIMLGEAEVRPGEGKNPPPHVSLLDSGHNPSRSLTICLTLVPAPIR